MPITLRPYQEAALEALDQARRAGVRRVLVTMPTGAGKTVLVASVLRSTPRGVFLVHRDELAAQAITTFRQVMPAEDVGLVKGAAANEVDRRVVVASVQTLARKRRRVQLLEAGRPEILVVDEAHHAAATSWRRVIEALEPSWLIGVTATPARTDGAHLGFDETVFAITLGELIAGGWLADVRGLRVEVEGIDWSSIRVEGGDWEAGSLGSALENAGLPAIIVAAWRRHVADRQTIVFVPTVSLAWAVRDQMRAVGVQAEAVWGEMPLTERREKIAAFRSGEVKVLTNAMLLTEGTDVPEVSCIVLGRPTRSRTLYSQMVGRGLRLAPGKQDCLVLEIGGNDESFDLARWAGLPPEKLKGGIKQVIDEIARGDLPPEKYTPVADSVIGELEAQVRTRSIEVIERAALHWVSVGRDWVLSVPGLSVRLLRRDAFRCDVVVVTPGKREVLATDVDLELGTGLAEETIRNAGAFALVNRNAAWRTQRAASEKQMKLLQKLGWEGDPTTLSAGEASDLITALQVRAPATPRQVAFLRNHGVDPTGLSRREASQIIEGIQAAKSVST